MRVTGLHVYPVKSLGGRPVDAAEVEPWGFRGDRRWALVDDAGDLVTARKVHQLLRLTAEVVDDETIRIRDRADGDSILVEAPVGMPPVPVRQRGVGSALPADPDVNDWLSDRAGVRVRLVWQEDPTARPVSEERGGRPGDTLSLADAGPLLLVSEASLAQLNDWVAAESGEPDVEGIDPEDLSDAAAPPAREPLVALRFRPNVVVDGETPFAEDGWPAVRIGDVELRTTMVCDRCVMTTIDPESLAGGKEPIRTLARHRRWEGATWFGTRLLRTGGGRRVSLGDPVVPLG